MFVSSEYDIFLRYKDGGKPGLQLHDWSQAKAEEVLNAWQRNFSGLVYQSSLNLNQAKRDEYWSVLNRAEKVLCEAVVQL